MESPTTTAPVANRQHIILGLDITVIIVSTVIISLRLYSRVIFSKTAGLDDVLAAFAWLFTVAETSVEIAVSPGTGHHLKDLPPSYLPKMFRLIFGLQICYLFAIALTRLSILAFLPRLNQFGMCPAVAVAGVAAFVVLMTIAFFIVALCLFMPTTKLQTGVRSPFSQRKFFDVHQGIGIGIDLFLLATPLWLIYTNMTRMRKNIGVILIFSVGLFEIVADCIRLVMLQRINGGQGDSWAFYVVAIWTSVELHIGFWVACFPALVPLLRMFVHRVGLSYDSSTQLDSSVDNHGWSGNKDGRLEKEVPSPAVKAQKSVYDPALTYPANLELGETRETRSDTTRVSSNAPAAS